MMEDVLMQMCAKDRSWFFEMIIGLVILIVVNILFRYLLKQFRQRSISLSRDWKEKIDEIFSFPFHVLIWILGVTFVAEVLGKRFNFYLFEAYLNQFRSTGVVVCLSWMFLRWKKEAFRYWLGKDQPIRKVDGGFIQTGNHVLSLALIVVAFMIILQIWGLNIAPLITFGGIGAAAIGFAAKDVIGNFFGGMMLHFNRPFMIGDMIVIPEKHLEGSVEEIGLYLTTIRDKDKRPVYLPNSLFATALVVNSSRMTHRRIEEKVGIRYDDFSRLDPLTENIRKKISSHPDIDSHLPVVATFHSFGPCTLNLYIDVYTLQTRYDHSLKVRHQVLMMIYEEVTKLGAEMPIPSMTIHTV